MEENKNNEVNEDVSLEDLRAILESQGLDIRALAKEAKELKKQKELETAIPAAENKKAQTNRPVYELVLSEYPDFVIRRSSKTTEKLLVIMVTQNTYYIKTVKNGVEKRDMLDEKNYAAFTADMNTIEMPEDFWLKKLEKGLAFGRSLLSFLSNEDIRKAILNRYLIDRGDLGVCPRDINIYNAIPDLLTTFKAKEVLITNYEFFAWLRDKFGIENTRDFIQETDISLADFNKSIRNVYYSHRGSYEFNEGLGKREFKYESFKNYVLYDSVRMGYAQNMMHFFHDWEDSLTMQEKIYGKVKEKYPEHLAEFHMQMSYKLNLMKQEIDDRNIKARAESAANLEHRIDDYVFIAPKVAQDFYDEAIAQSNCLAGYVSKYADGKDYIVFMRNKDMPEVSLVTIELGLDGRLIQAYQARNRKVTDEQRMVIDKWLNTVVNPFFAKAAA